VKGVILAGGTGSRLDPLTRITNKHLLPIDDRPMVSFAIEALVRAGITELMLVTGGTHAGEFFRLLGNGHEHGIDKLLYAYQEKPGGIAEEFSLLVLGDLADIVDAVAVDQRFDRLVEIGAVVIADLGRHLELHSGAQGDIDGAVRPLVARQPAEKGKIWFVRRRHEVRGVKADRQPVMDGRQPIGIGKPSSLAARDRDQRKARKALIGRRQIDIVEPAMRRRHRLFRHLLEEREMQEMAEVKMNDIKVVGSIPHIG